MTRKIILDCDPGHDDALALLLAGASAAIDLVAVTTVAGNAEIEKTTENALQVCELAEMTDVPVFRGADGPLLRDPITALDIHGQSGMEGSSLPSATKPLAPGHAVDFIIQELKAAEGKITLVAIGPLTNIAMVINKEPEAANKIEEIVFMGGGYLGNTTPAAEFNMYADPEAAKIVLESNVPLTMCELEMTGQSSASAEIIDKIKAIDNPVAAFASQILEYADKTFRNLFGTDNPAIHDACAVAYCIDPDVFTTKNLRVDMELKGEFTYGMTVIDRQGKTQREPNARVGEALDQDKFWHLMFDAIRSYTQKLPREREGGGSLQ